MLLWVLQCLNKHSKPWTCVLKVMSQSLNDQLHTEIHVRNIPSQRMTSICTQRHYCRLSWDTIFIETELSSLPFALKLSQNYTCPRKVSETGAAIHWTPSLWMLAHPVRGRMAHFLCDSDFGAQTEERRLKNCHFCPMERKISLSNCVWGVNLNLLSQRQKQSLIDKDTFFSW